MARVKQQYKLKKISAKDLDALYEEYINETKKMVSKEQRTFEKGKWHSVKKLYDIDPNKFKILTKTQFEAEVKLMTAEGKYGKRLVSAIRKLVMSDVKWTFKQMNAELYNLNNFIKEVWTKAAGRSVKGRASKILVLNTSSLTPEEYGLLNIMVSEKGNNLNFTGYLLTLEDIVGQSNYFQLVFNWIYNNMVTSGDDIFNSF